jgi:hypothetical protein
MYLTEEFADGLTISVSVGPSTTKKAPSYPTEEFTEELVTPVDSEAKNLQIPNRLGISAANPMAGLGRPPTVVKGTGVPIKPTIQHWKTANDIMSYAYSKYFNHPDAAAHVKQIRSIWAVNHETQGLTPTEQEQSMIVEF